MHRLEVFCLMLIAYDKKLKCHGIDTGAVQAATGTEQLQPTRKLTGGSHPTENPSGEVPSVLILMCALGAM
jgi:hypothetical protein